MRALVLVVSAFLSLSAAAQTAEQIQATAPQLTAFAGSDANLQALVNGLSNGQTITLVTQDATGILQIVTFTPPSALGGGVAASLEQARSALIARGITQPTAQQIAVALMGGSVVAASGVAPINGVPTGTSTGTGIQVRNDLSAASGATAGLGTFSSSANLQALTSGMLKGTSITLTGAANQNVTFTIPGGAMTVAEVNQALTLASQLLAQQGIVNPTPSQIQAALVGGTVVGPNGSIVLQGVLQNRTTTVAGAPTPPVNIPDASTGATSVTQTPSPLVGGNAPVPGVDGVRAPNSSEGARLGGKHGG
jgi:mannitol/fructose-specific phosphotransferase system IIA component (Ntr-type)